MTTLYDKILAEECKAEEVSFELVSNIIELNEAIDSKDSREVIKRKKQVKFLLEESINAL